MAVTEVATLWHDRGSPDCSEACSESERRHQDDPPADWPETCPECGGSGYGCYPRCLDVSGQRWEPWEGLTGVQEAREYDEGRGVMGVPWGGTG